MCESYQFHRNIGLKVEDADTDSRPSAAITRAETLAAIVECYFVRIRLLQGANFDGATGEGKEQCKSKICAPGCRRSPHLAAGSEAGPRPYATR